VESVSIKASNPLVNSSGGTRAKPVGYLDIDVLNSPSEETISQEMGQVRI
jgi:hypothetical protein